MSTLILTTSDSGAGHFKQEKRADRVHSFTHRLVNGPVPVSGPPELFFERRRLIYEREGLFSEPHWFDPEDKDCEAPRFRRVWSALPQLCDDHDKVELWVDPDPNAQLVMLHLLDWLATLPGIAGRLWIRQSDSPLGQRCAGDWVLPPRRVEPGDLALARRGWSAFGASTPQTWSELRNDPELDRMPGLHQAIERTLAELPDATGLGETARRILSLVDRQQWWSEAERPGSDMPERRLADVETHIRRLIDRVQKSRERVPLWYFEIGELVCELAAAGAPALSGPTETHFDVDLRRDETRRQRFYASPITLTALGRRLRARETDWTAHNKVHRWCGGTRITNDTLWRWDANARQPIAPTRP